MSNLQISQSEIPFLKLLSEKFPTIATASAEIINLQAILNLPKGTEHFLSDIHGEYDSFQHVVKNASGVIKEKIKNLFEITLTTHERDELTFLIYYPEEILQNKFGKNSSNMFRYHSRPMKIQTGGKFSGKSIKQQPGFSDSETLNALRTTSGITLGVKICVLYLVMGSNKLTKSKT